MAESGTLDSDVRSEPRPWRVRALALVAALGAWWLVYTHLVGFARWLTSTAFGLTEGTRMAGAVEFFVFEVPKVILLLVLVVFGVGIVRSFFTPERTRSLLAGRLEVVGNVLAAGLGVVTPFCSCSAVPLFIGFVEAGVPLGVTFSFLIAAPMVNEVAVVLLCGLVGWRVAALYVAAGLSVAIVSGWTIGRLKLERHVEGWVYEIRSAGDAGDGQQLTFAGRIDYGLEQVRTIVGKVWPFIVAGIAVGAGIHGYVPEGALASVMGKGAWWSVPAAVVLGVPMYSNAAGIVPVIQALLGKGAALGTALAFMMSVIALSLPEMIILRKVLKPRLIGAFVAIVAFGIAVVGFLFNAIM
ncbi:MAG: permease [Armatimonadetes bacterium]|nr:permease [Armatimonadota bacterium]